MASFQDDGWVLVRRRRPPPRHPQFFDRPRDGAPTLERRKDSAFPISHTGRWNNRNLPNRPVPPVDMGRDPPSRAVFDFDTDRHSTTRTYASVLRQGLDSNNRTTVPRATHNATGQQRTERRPQNSLDNNRRKRRQNFNNNTKPPQLEPEMFQLARKCFKMIKMVHHLQNVAPKPNKPEPIMITKVVENLTNLIKPASPTPETLDLIIGNAKNWGYNTLTILEDHYKTELEKTKEDLSLTLLPDWKQAFQTAARWAKNSLSRLKDDTLEHVEAIIMTCQEQDQDTMTDTANIPKRTTTTYTTLANQETQTDHIHKSQTKTKSQPRTRLSPIHQETIGTMTDPDWSPLQRSPNPLDTENEPLTHPILQTTPQPQRPHRTTSRNSCVVPEHLVPHLIEELTPIRTKTAPIKQLPIQVLPTDNECLIQIHQPPTPDPEIQPIQQTPEPTSPPPDSLHNQTDPQLGDDLLGFFDLSFTPTPKTPIKFKVNRHINTQRKLVDWGLSVNKKWVFLGDSNLSRIPPHTISNLQIESFPGANFRHIQEVLQKATVHVKVEKLVLSFGINCRSQKAKETAVKQLQGAIREAKKRFPHSEIWIPLLNYSLALPTLEKTTLNILNQHIQKNVPYLPTLNRDLFNTTNDMIHWTKETAQAMFKHWTQCLNLNPP